MEDLRDPELARDFLKENGYVLTRGCNHDVPHITYKTRTGNGLWEGDADNPGVASENGWNRREKSTCCAYNEKQKIGANYCGDCGNGINGNVMWVRMNEEDDFDRLIEELEISA